MRQLRRIGVILSVLIFFAAFSPAQDEPKKKAPRRFGYEVDETTFPQKTPAETMASIAKAIDRKKVDYLLAHMTDPSYVDYWVNRYKQEYTKGKEEGKRLLAFDRLATETTLYYNNDPLIVKDLRIFAKEGKWEEKDDIAEGTAEKVPARKVFLKKIGDRWFLENRQK